MLGYEKVNKEVGLPLPHSSRPRLVAVPSHPHEGWLIDLSEVAAQPCRESIAHQNEIVASFASGGTDRDHER